MDDLISRQAAIDEIRKCRFVVDAIEKIRGLPSAQPEVLACGEGELSAQPEIIRCKDCKHYYFAENRVPEEQSWVCDVWHVNQTAHMGYCFKAERRSDG